MYPRLADITNLISEPLSQSRTGSNVDCLNLQWHLIVEVEFNRNTGSKHATRQESHLVRRSKLALDRGCDGSEVL